MRGLLILILLLNVQVLLAQKSIPQSEYLVMEAKSRSMINTSLDSSWNYANLILESNNDLHKAFGYGIRSYLYQLYGKEQESNEDYQKATRLFGKVKDSDEKRRVHSLVLTCGGLVDWKRENYAKAIKKYEEARTLSASLNDQIQLIKIDNNISRLNGDAGNFKSAIQAAKESEKLTDRLKSSYTQAGYLSAKSNVFFNLGFYYHKWGLQKNSPAIIDSAIHYYNKTIAISDDFPFTKLSAQTNLAGLFAVKNQYKKAEKGYLNALHFCKENDLIEKQLIINFNLGIFYYRQQKYTEALTFFNDVQNIYEKHQIGELENINADFYRAYIYEQLGQPDKARVFLKRFGDKEKQIDVKAQQILEMNYFLEKKDIKQEVKAIEARLKAKEQKVYLIYGLVGLGLLILLIYLKKVLSDKKKANLKVEELKKRFLEKKEKSLYPEPVQSLSLNDDKEKEILSALESIVEKGEYLKSEFNLQFAAKKIKTNTAYLSHVVNKNYEKSFSEFSNELKINYVIEQLMTNSTYQKYSTQAIAESVGYKSAVSFTKTFKKRTGVTPVQFLNSVD